MHRQHRRPISRAHHSAVVDADRWPDETVLLNLDRRTVCTKCAERVLRILYHDGDTQPAALELVDRIRAAVSSKTHTIKQRLNQLEDLLRE
jgi:hypothetical protein